MFKCRSEYASNAKMGAASAKVLRRFLVNESTGSWLITESAEDKNRKRAVKFANAWLEKHGYLGQLKATTMNGKELVDGEAVEHETAKSVENARKMANAKYMPGAVRMYLELQEDPATRNSAGADLGRLNQIVKIIASDPTHTSEYDGDFNGMKFKELDEKFATSVKASLDKDMAEVGGRTYKANPDYEIVRIPDFETASKYSDYVTWCVTHGEGAYDSYTHDGTGIFYFCLRRDYKDVERKAGEGCPLDEYGKSMIAVSVNDDGSLNTCTCRWNHDRGGDDNLLTTKEISELLGLNFYATFRPRDPAELMEKYREKAVPNKFADKMGWVCVQSDDDSRSYDYVSISRKEGATPRLVKYREVFNGKSSSAENTVGIALDHFYWYNGDTGKMIDPPDEVMGNIECINWSQLTTLKGCPRSIGMGVIDCTECQNLEDVSEMPTTLGGVCLKDCPHIREETIEPLADNKGVIESMIGSTVEIDSEGTVTALVPFDWIENVYEPGRDGLSWKFISDVMSGETFDLFNVDYVPNMSEMNGDQFDKTLSDNGFDLRWGDISKLDDGEPVEGMSSDQAEEISEMLEDDFEYEGSGISDTYRRCQEDGMADEAYETIMGEFESELCIDRKYDVVDGKVKVVIPKRIIALCVKRFLTLDFSNSTTIFEIMQWSDDYDEVEAISVREPYYGFDGFNSDGWDEAVRRFADRVVEILSRPPKQKDAKGQLFFDFDKDYLDNPRNKPRRSWT